MMQQINAAPYTSIPGAIVYRATRTAAAKLARAIRKEGEDEQDEPPDAPQTAQQPQPAPRPPETAQTAPRPAAAQLALF